MSVHPFRECVTDLPAPLKANPVQLACVLHLKESVLNGRLNGQLITWLQTAKGPGLV